MRTWVLVLLLVNALNAWGQSTLGVVLGTIRDATGAVVANASVRLTNVGRIPWSETVSDTNGDYGFRNVKAGTYTVSISQPGFQTFTVRDIVLYLARRSE